MITRLIAIAGWLAAGHMALAGLYWLLLSTPESNVATLAASALTVVVMALLFGCVEAVGLLGWQPDAGPRGMARRAVGKAPGVWLGGAIFVAVWFLANHTHAHWNQRSGEIDAWLMAQFGWANTENLHRGFGWLLALVRFLGLSIAIALASTVAAAGFGALRSARWIREAFSPRRLLVLAGILLVFVWLPWRAVDWRPRWLSPNWQETAFVAAKLGAIYVLANIGWALVLGVGRARSHRPNSA